MLLNNKWRLRNYSLAKALSTFVVLLCLLSNIKVAAQNYSRINFGWEQGFKAATVYNIYQDSKSYIWASTENGLMKYNGHEFRAYTTRDGLPDNEILTIYEDRTGRLWLLPFANAICYYRNGEIFNQQNDSILKKLVLNDRPRTVFQDLYGNIWLHLIAGTLIMIRQDGQIRRLDNIDSHSIYNITIGKDGLLKAYTSGSRIYKFSDGHFSLFASTPFNDKEVVLFQYPAIYVPSINRLWVYSDTPSKSHSEGKLIPVLPVWHHLSIRENDDSTAFIGSENGSYLLSLKDGKMTGPLLPGYFIGAATKANDGSFWFATHGSGIARLIGTSVRTVELPKPASPVIFVRVSGKEVLATTSHADFIRVHPMGKGAGYKAEMNKMYPGDPFEYCVFAIQNELGKWIICSGQTKLKSNLQQMPERILSVSCKQVIQEDAKHLLIASLSGIFRLDIDKFSLTDTFLFLRRTTAVAKLGTTIYAGTLNGLFACGTDRKYSMVLPYIPALQNRITALCADSMGMLWCANGNAELIGIKDNAKVVQVGLRQGLQCNRISCIKVSGKFIWIGTDNGLFAILPYAPFTIVRHITFANGLLSSQVNSLDIHDGSIWVGTATGINYFDEDDVFKFHEAKEIVINNIMNDNKRLQPTVAELEVEDKSLTIDFDIVDFSGGTSPRFEYRLNGKGDWIPIESKQLYFSSIPMGHFEISLKASSPNWRTGMVSSQWFYNPPPFYSRPWFIVLCIVGSISIVVIIIFLSVKRIRSKDQQQLTIQQNLLRLEQMALQGQMNPHFIFNCIASIKQYYNEGDRQKADNFVDSFSLLIRQTFEMSAETFVPLEKELSYLEQYLIIEQQRFGNTFTFNLAKQPELITQTIAVPAMLLQPMVENAIRHGIRHLPDGFGQIFVEVRQVEQLIMFTITDNGIGRKKSREINERYGIPVMTSSMVNEKRIHILNQLFFGKINMYIDDLLGEGGLAKGTRVIITYPIDLFQLSRR